MDTIMNATIGQLIGGGLGVIAFISVFIEITPIRFNPVSDFLHWLGKKMTGDLMERVAALEDTVEEREAVSCRVRILRFSDELRRNVNHSQESFEQVIADIDYYEKYCIKHPDFKNNKTIVAKKRIIDVYEACLEQNNFL